MTDEKNFFVLDVFNMAKNIRNILKINYMVKYDGRKTIFLF